MTPPYPLFTLFAMRTLGFAGVFFVIAEVFFRCVIPASVDPAHHYDAATKLYTCRAGDTGVLRRGRFSQLNVSWRVNDAGCIADSDYNRPHFANHHRILMIGDSFIQGLHVNSDDRIATRLELADPTGLTKVFAFGSSMRPFVEHEFVARAGKRYSPHTIVCFLTSGDICISLISFRRLEVHHQLSIEGPEIKEIPPVPRSQIRKSITRLVKPSALLRYVVSGRKYVPFVGHRDDFARLNFNDDRLQVACDYTVKHLREENPNANIVFMVDANRRAIQSKPEVCPESIPTLPILEAAVGDLEKVFICDLTPGFYVDFLERQHTFEVTVDDHWNAHAHSLASRLLYRFLMDHDLIPDHRIERKLHGDPH